MHRLRLIVNYNNIILLFYYNKKMSKIEDDNDSVPELIPMTSTKCI